MNNLILVSQMLIAMGSLSLWRDRAWTPRYALDETMRQIGWGTDR